MYANRSEPDTARRPRALLVDDQPEIRRLLRSVLETLGYDVTTAEEFEEAGALLLFLDFDLLCFDLDLRGLEGLEGLELLAEVHARTPSQRMLVSTGNSDPRVHAACRERGAVGVYCKGRPLGELVDLIRGPQEATAS